MKNVKVAGLFWGMTVLGAPAAEALVLNDQKVLEVSIGHRGLTRLTVQGDAIENVLVHPVHLGEGLQAQGGHVFMAPEGRQDPFYLTVMTRKGVIQDLRVRVVSGEGHPVILTAPAPVQKQEPLREETRLILEGQMLAFLQGHVPAGFRKMRADVPVRRVSGMTLTGEGVWVLGRAAVLVYQAENPSNRPVVLPVQDLFQEGDQAITADRAVLMPQGKARVIVVRLRGDTGHVKTERE